MALVSADTRCAICRKALGAGREFFATSGTFLRPEDPLFAFCDAAMHWGCYEAWPHRSEFGQSFIRAVVDSVQSDPHWGLAYVSERVAVAVNTGREIAPAHEGAAPSGAIQVHLAETCSTIRLPLSPWKDWVEGNPIGNRRVGTRERQAIEGIRAELARALPDAESVVNRIDWDAKRVLLAEQRDRERQGREARRRELSAHQAKWTDVARAGPVCPTCRSRENIRAVDLSPNRESYFVCGSCGRSFDPC